METVWLVDSCLPPDGIPQVAEPPLRYLPCASFIGGAWRGIGAERERSWIWLELSEAQFRRYPGCKTSISRVDMSWCVVYRQIYTNFYTVNFTSRQFQPYTIILIRKNSFQRCYIYIYKIETIKYPSLYNASWYILQPNNNEFARKREREKEIGDA